MRQPSERELVAANSVPLPRLIAWEITRRCNLFCAHCRADAEDGCYGGELSTQECFALIGQMTQLGRPILILTGGEPLMREDVFEIAGYATQKGLRAVMAPNGTLVTKETAERLRHAGILRISISLDFPSAEEHDRFRGMPGAFDGALAGIQRARQAGVEVQINSTISKLNVAYLDGLLQLAIDVGAVAFHPFLLVPTGRGKGLGEQELAPEEYEETLNWIYERQQSLGERIFFKPTDAPHYMRVLRQRGGRPALHPHQQSSGNAGCSVHGALNSLSRGCLAGSGFMFISHVGDVQGCGYLTARAGNVREQPLPEIWAHAPLFRELRDFRRLKGKCGECEFKLVCGGCRARAYEATGDYMEEEPYCVYEPRRRRQGGSHVT